MTAGWPRVPLGDLLTQVWRDELVDASKEYRVLGARWYAGGLFLKDVKSGQEIRADRLYRVRAGDFVYNRLFAWKGSFALATDEADGCFVSNEFPCFEIDPARLDGNFLWSYFRQERTWTEALGLSSGATPTSRNRLKESLFLKMEMPLPLLPDQQRIVARVDQVASKIREACDLRAIAIQHTEALLDSTRRALVGSVPLDGWIPLHRVVARIENGKSPQCEARPAGKGEWGVLKVGAVSFGVFDERENKALPTGLAVNPHHEVHAGDFLMSRANTTELVGACALVETTPPHLLLSDKTFRLRFRDRDPVIPRWLNQVLKSPALRSQITRAASGTSPTMKNISKDKVLQLLLPPHSSSEQRRVVESIAVIEEHTRRLHSLQTDTAVELDALLPSILDRAFKGEL